MDIDFNRPKRLKPTILQKAPLQLQRSVTTRQKVFKVVDMQSILKSLHRANPSAAIFTVLPSVSTEARIDQHAVLWKPDSSTSIIFVQWSESSSSKGTTF